MYFSALLYVTIFPATIQLLSMSESHCHFLPLIVLFTNL